jgi:5-methylcytosine-specific restriction endonuclease McrBC GTP-binding regulatory subunit McrB
MITNDEITLLAQEALKKILAEHGPDFTFPADVIWQYTKPGVHVPSTARPHQPKRLMKEGFLEKTGGMVKAQSEARAGSSTAEYRFGRALVPRTLPATFPSKKSVVVSDYLSNLQQQMDSEGYIISTGELANFYLALMVSPLVILSGISGTGKSLLPRKFANHTEAEFTSVPVQPQWSDNSDLFGYVPTLSPNQFVEGALINSIVRATDNPTRLLIVLLDEMNLAPVEHYFSDFLSVIETRRRVESQIVTDPLPIELPKGQSNSEEKYRHLAGIHLPNNLRVIGTANMDESTHSFSPKVLDRAFTIEFDDPDLTAFTTASAGVKANLSKLAQLVIDPENPISIQEARNSSQDIFDEAASLLQEIQDILSPAGIKFGYRTRDAILLYLHHWKGLELSSVITANAAFDFCLLQKVLPKISGSGDKLTEALTTLSKWLGATRAPEDTEGTVYFSGPFMRSHQKVERMIGLLEIDGATHFWGI